MGHLCGATGKSTACNAGIPDRHRFVSWLLHSDCAPADGLGEQQRTAHVLGLLCPRGTPAGSSRIGSAAAARAIWRAKQPGEDLSLCFL